MEAKKKAEELIEKYFWGACRTKEQSIQCAIICVDEMINDTDASSPFEEERVKYWQEVKQHLINQ